MGHTWKKGHTCRKMGDLKKLVIFAKMGHTRKKWLNFEKRSHLQNGSHLEKWVILKKGLNFEKWVTLEKMGHTSKKRGALRKMWHTRKNCSNLENRFTLKNGLQVQKWVNP